MAKRKADDEDQFEAKLSKTEECELSELNTPTDGKSKRVRKKSAKLLEMEEYEVFEKKIFKNPSKVTASGNSTKIPVKKNKAKPTDALTVSGLHSLADVATAELNTEEIKPLISSSVKVSEQSPALSCDMIKPPATAMAELSPNLEKQAKIKPVKLKTVSPPAVTNPSPTFAKPETPKLKPPKPKQSFEDQLIGPDTIAVQNKIKIKKVKKVKPAKDKPTNSAECPGDSQSKDFVNGQESLKVKSSVYPADAKPEHQDSDFKSDEDQPAIWPSQIKEENNDHILVKLKKKKIKKTKLEVDRQGMKKEGIGDCVDNDVMKYSAISDSLPAQEGCLEIDLDRKQEGKSAKKKRLKKPTEHSSSMEQNLNNEETKEDIEEGYSSGTQTTNVYSNTEVMAMKLKTSSEKKASGSSTKMKEKRFRRRGPTAYTMFSNNYRTKVLAENPGIDFAQISKRLGEIWQCLPAKEKMMWKRKARQRVNKIKKLNNGGAADSINDMVFTSKVPSVFKRPSTSVPGKAKTIAKSQAKQPVKLSAATSPDVSATASSSPSSSSSSSTTAAAASSSSLLGQLLTSHTQEKSTSDTAHATMHKADDTVPCNPIDVAAHLKLLGDSLQTIGFRLQEHKGPIAVQGSLSVLLDSSLCAMASIMCLTNQLPEVHPSLNKTHSRNLDNIAYIMPGIG